MYDNRSGLKLFPFWNDHAIRVPEKVIRRAIDTGAMTGPIHGMGIKNNISHSNSDAGQSINTLSQI